MARAEGSGTAVTVITSEIAYSGRVVESGWLPAADQPLALAPVRPTRGLSVLGTCWLLKKSQPL
jgi:hypothetical protein